MSMLVRYAYVAAQSTLEEITPNLSVKAVEKQSLKVNLKLIYDTTNTWRRGLCPLPMGDLFHIPLIWQTHLKRRRR